MCLSLPCRTLKHGIGGLLETIDFQDGYGFTRHYPFEEKRGHRVGNPNYRTRNMHKVHTRSAPPHLMLHNGSVKFPCRISSKGI